MGIYHRDAEALASSISTLIEITRRKSEWAAPRASMPPEMTLIPLQRWGGKAKLCIIRTNFAVWWPPLKQSRSTRSSRSTFHQRDGGRAWPLCLPERSVNARKPSSRNFSRCQRGENHPLRAKESAARIALRSVRQPVLTGSGECVINHQFLFGRHGFGWFLLGIIHFDKFLMPCLYQIYLMQITTLAIILMKLF